MRGLMFGAGTLALLAMNCAAAQARDEQACVSLSGLELPGYDLRIESAKHVAGEEPPHCLLTGSFEHRTGVDGVPYAIGFGLALPDDWSGRFLFQGGGGLNGSVRPPIGATAAGEKSALERGFAVVSNDGGHKGESFDASFKKDQIAALNFAQGSVDKVTRLARAIVDKYYGTPASRSYFAGCSTGGREGMIAVQRYPDLFDGIIVGAPAMRTGRSNMSLAAKAVAMNRIAAKGADGLPDRMAALGDSDRESILTGLLEACDGLDGAEDGMIFNMAACAFDPRKLACEGEKGGTCLTVEQAEVVAETFAPTFDASGRAAYPAFPYDTGIVSEADTIPGILRVDDKRNRQFRNTALDFDVDAILAALDGDPHQHLIDTNGWTDLGSFAGQGGRIMFFHGMSDPGGLDQFDMLSELVEWVENGVVPDRVVASGSAFPERTRPLCPYPAYAHYSGSGDAENAASFECRQ